MSSSLLQRFNWGVTSRTVVAILVGYLFSIVASLWLNQLLGLADRDARLMTNMAFFVFYALVAIWVFSPKSHLKAVLSTIIATSLLWALWWLVKGATV